MKFKPKTETEVQSAGLLKPGEYKFVVADAKERQSKAGNDMIELILECPRPDGGGKARVWDYLVLSESFMFKIRHFAYSAGLGERYESGELVADDCLGRVVRAEVEIRPPRDGYGARNNIVDYVAEVQDQSEEGWVSELPPDLADEDIPFAWALPFLIASLWGLTHAQDVLQLVI